MDTKSKALETISENAETAKKVGIALLVTAVPVVVAAVTARIVTRSILAEDPDA